MAQLIETAIHEAGHAIMAIKFKKEFEYVTIIAGDDSLGIIRFTQNGFRITKLLDGTSDEILEYNEIDKIIRDEIIITLSGYTAELKFGVDNKIGAEEDLSSCFDLALSHLGDGDSASILLDECLEQSKNYVDEYWIAIQIIADKLIEHKKIDRKQVFSFLLEKGVFI
jgi:ATP-dependent Zn protease